MLEVLYAGLQGFGITVKYCLSQKRCHSAHAFTKKILSQSPELTVYAMQQLLHPIDCLSFAHPDNSRCHCFFLCHVKTGLEAHDSYRYGYFLGDFAPSFNF